MKAQERTVWREEGDQQEGEEGRMGEQSTKGTIAEYDIHICRHAIINPITCMLTSILKIASSR